MCGRGMGEDTQEGSLTGPQNCSHCAMLLAVWLLCGQHPTFHSSHQRIKRWRSHKDTEPFFKNFPFKVNVHTHPRSVWHTITAWLPMMFSRSWQLQEPNCPISPQSRLKGRLTERRVTSQRTEWLAASKTLWECGVRRRDRSKVLMLQLFPLKPLCRREQLSRSLRASARCTIPHLHRSGGKGYGLALNLHPASWLSTWRVWAAVWASRGWCVCVFQWKRDVAPSLRYVGVLHWFQNILSHLAQLCLYRCLSGSFQGASGRSDATHQELHTFTRTSMT